MGLKVVDEWQISLGYVRGSNIYVRGYLEAWKTYTIFATQISKHGVVVQLVRIPACHAGGRGFESRPYRQDKESIVLHYTLFFVGTSFVDLRECTICMGISSAPNAKI